ncbi:MAG: hypothetical protein JWM85_197 [Acidimicrobiaceae bacterium]|nr:hypothetical protein [Acidimicrobiaceae bacterium]
MAVEVVTLSTPELGDRSYLVHDGHHALVVDPQRDLDEILSFATAARLSITHVAETHVHNDYLSGGLELARRAGAAYLVAAAEEVGFDRTPVRPGDRIEIGSFSVEAVATPGHTTHHLAYVVRDEHEPVAVLSGGSLLFDSVGRTDLSGDDLTAQLAGAQYRSVRELAGSLPDDTQVLPTHGFGSFCASGPPSSRASSTISEERRTNPALTAPNEERFVAQLLSGLTAYPSYYAKMGPLNQAGVGPVRAAPEPLDPAELPERISAGQWVVDLRHRRAFAGDHLPGTVDFELAQPFTTYFGWVVPDDAEVVLLASTPDQVAEAARSLARIGRERLAGSVAGELGTIAEEAGLATGSFPVASFAQLADAYRRSPPPVVLDVRRPDEWEAAHLLGSTNRFVASLPARLDDLPEGTLWVHCASGYRAGVASSILDRAGRSVVLVDDEWANAVASGVPITSGSDSPALAGRS